VNIDALTATIVEIRRRQVWPMAPRVAIKPIAEEVAQALLEGKADPRLRWHKNKVKVLAAVIFPMRTGFNKMTVQGQRRQLWRYLENILKPHGWVKEPGNIFVKKVAVISA
jgi:hypothetical protein